MLYSEFLKGTRAPETPDTYDQFQIIGQIYEDCEGMTKEEAYRIWKQTYGRELKRRELRQRERLELLINREDYDHVDRPHRAAIYHELSTLFWAAYYNKDGSRCRLATEGRCFTDVYGISCRKYGTRSLLYAAYGRRKRRNGTPGRRGRQWLKPENRKYLEVWTICL